MRWKAGRCPEPHGFGICVEACRSDYDCPGEQKCVSYNCLLACLFAAIYLHEINPSLNSTKNILI